MFFLGFGSFSIYIALFESKTCVFSILKNRFLPFVSSSSLASILSNPWFTFLFFYYFLSHLNLPQLTTDDSSKHILLLPLLTPRIPCCSTYSLLFSYLVFPVVLLPHSLLLSVTSASLPSPLRPLTTHTPPKPFPRIPFSSWKNTFPCNLQSPIA